MDKEKVSAIRTAFDDALSAAGDKQTSLVEVTVYDRYRRASQALSGDSQLPGYVEGELVEDLMLAMTTLLRVAASRNDEGQEFEHILPENLRIVWRTKEWRSGVAMVAGECKLVPERERDLYEVEPAWTITLNAAWWCALDERGRERLMHHELMHAATGGKVHPVEEFPATVREYGIFGHGQALMIVEAMNRKDFRKSLESLLNASDPAIPKWVP